jgi:hypothetical protein
MFQIYDVKTGEIVAYARDPSSARTKIELCFSAATHSMKRMAVPRLDWFSHYSYHTFWRGQLHNERGEMIGVADISAHERRAGGFSWSVQRVQGNDRPAVAEGHAKTRKEARALAQQAAVDLILTAHQKAAFLRAEMLLQQ